MMPAKQPSARAFVATAAAWTGLRDPTGGAIPGTFVDMIRRQVGRSGVGEWDVALIHHWGFWSQYDMATETSAWPLEPAENPAVLSDVGARHDIIMAEPRTGDIFLQYSPLRCDFVRAGVVAYVAPDRPAGAHYWDIVSIEGNSGERGELGGSNVVRIRRRLAPDQGDRCIRWTLARSPRHLGPSSNSNPERQHWRSRAAQWQR